MKTYRFFFNCREEIEKWSYDEGVGTPERTVKDVSFFGCDAKTKFDGTKHLPEASAWIQVRGTLIKKGKKAYIYGKHLRDE